jgi:AraC-like DNA-binding protein
VTTSSGNDQAEFQLDGEFQPFGRPHSASQWKEILSSQHGLACKLHSTDRFEGLRTDWSLGDLCVLKASISGQTLRPERQRMKPEFQDSILIKLFLDGHTRTDGHKDSATFGPGGMLIVDPSACYFEEIMSKVRFSVVIVPKRVLRERGIRCDLHSWIKPDLSSPNISMIREQLLWVTRSSQQIDPALGRRVGTQIVDMMDILLTQGGQTGIARASDLTLMRVKEHIRERLSEPGMDAAAIANATRLSISYLNHLFKNDGKSLMNYLWTLRLEKASRLFTSSAASATQIEEIAWQCGFASSSHFCHRFRHHYGMTPSGYRASKRLM